MTQHPTKLTRKELYENVWSQPIPPSPRNTAFPKSA